MTIAPTNPSGDPVDMDSGNAAEENMTDINPNHYRQIPGVQCADVSQHFSSCAGQALQYIWRHALKGGARDLAKAAWHLVTEIRRIDPEGAQALLIELRARIDELLPIPYAVTDPLDVAAAQAVDEGRPLEVVLTAPRRRSRRAR